MMPNTARAIKATMRMGIGHLLRRIVLWRVGLRWYLFVLLGIPAILVNGRFDFQAPIGNAWELRRVWPRSELVIVDNAGHAGSAEINRELIRATDRFKLA